MTSVIKQSIPYDYISDPDGVVAYLAGAIGIILQTQDEKHINYKIIKEILQRSAEPLQYMLLSAAVPFTRQSAGLFNLYKSIYSHMNVTPNIIDFSKHLNMQQTKTIYISNRIVAKKYILSYKNTIFISIDDKDVETELDSTTSNIQREVAIPTMVNANLGQNTPVNIDVCIPNSVLPNHRLLYYGYITISADSLNNSSRSPETVMVPFHGVMIH
jgi:hypothetical protein